MNKLFAGLKRYFLIAAFFILIAVMMSTPVGSNVFRSVGEPIDSLNGVRVYFNGNTGTVVGRNVADGYNIGLRYQCVEFVKRYYLKVYNHRMPDAYGHAKSFYDSDIPQAHLNKRRGLKQYANPGSSKPKIGDLIVWDGDSWNEFGHVAIVSNVLEDEVEIIQQNGGYFQGSRKTIDLVFDHNQWYVADESILGWLRK